MASENRRLSILQELIDQKPRETSGSASSNRFSFQVDWAFSRLIELHEANKSFVIILDFHEDVVIGDSDVAPTQLDFFQVKTDTTSPWTESKLLHRAKPAKGKKLKKKILSILGKLYLHRVKFPNIPGTLAFVSNMRCDLNFDSRVKNNPEILFAKLITATKRKIAKQLREEHDLANDPDCDDCLKFIVTDLDVRKHERDVVGDLAVLCGKLWPDGSFPVTTLYRAIGEQLRARSNYEQLPDTVDELLRRKAITSVEVSTIFQQVGGMRRLSQLWQNAQQALMNEQVPAIALRRLRSGWNRYGVDRENPSNQIAIRLRMRILDAINVVQNSGPALQTHAQIVEALASAIDKEKSGFDIEYLKGAILLEWFDEPVGKLSSTDSKPPGEAA